MDVEGVPELATALLRRPNQGHGDIRLRVCGPFRNIHMIDLDRSRCLAAKRHLVFTLSIRPSVSRITVTDGPSLLGELVIIS